MIEKFPAKFEYDQVVLLEDDWYSSEYYPGYTVFGFLNKSVPVGKLVFREGKKEWYLRVRRYFSTGDRIIGDVEREKLRILILTGKTVEDIDVKVQELYKELFQKYDLQIEIHNSFAIIFCKYFNLSEEEVDQMFKSEFDHIQLPQGEKYSLIFSMYVRMMEYMMEHKFNPSLPNNLEEICPRVKTLINEYDIDWRGLKYEQVKEKIEVLHSQTLLLIKEIKTCQ